ncbi:N-acyl-D-amino-acid deacylase family protein [Phytopseudomonas seleniipraecipitans]|uniref:N-acyl-D-amino-acid deacylase n=1 Tax=Phytopseudomonas seleniipraecipitans TaxID=640205 RepID=A0A1G7NFV9_9GAMM|nr:D-aminoacylase [Pseudomonas seleniipraecipitans]SDF72913.1 N-acyl-D-amino-acid deacylase [Pseudomonas seleniipraecipitans]
MPQHASLLIRNVQLIDGTGAAPFTGDLAVSGERIVALGDLRDWSADTCIEGNGRCLSPGFIDVHTHDDINVIRMPEMLPKLTQGITTVIVGNCGISASPVSLSGPTVPDPMNLLGRVEDFRYPAFATYAESVTAAQPSVNVAALVGHTALRATFMERFDRPASTDEIQRMRTTLRQALADGAIGMSSGLAYINARHAPAAEMQALVEEVGAAGGIYTTHLRDEFAGLLDAMDEAVATARHGQAPLVISHLKCAGVGNWGTAPLALEKLEQAAQQHSCHCDCYPYTAGSSTLDLGQVTDEFEIFITWSDAHPQMARQTLQAIADTWGVSLLDAARRLQPAGAVYHNMAEDDMRRILRHPLSMVGSDGLPNDPHPHPRLWGAFPRVIGHFCRDQGLFTLPEAIHKMTGLSARSFGLCDRGELRVGAYADLTLFDFDKVQDSATFTTPIAAAKGIELVVVNGAVAYQHGRLVERAGRLLKRAAKSPEL